MEKLYDRIDWVNNTTPALNQTNLNRMSKALDDLDDRVILIAGNVLVTVPQLQEMLEDCAALEARLEAMTENPPYIGDNGHWYIWDTDTGAYVDSGIDASITVEIADITMLEPNATPYVTNTGTDTDPIFHLFIPRGQPGKGISSIAKTGTSGYVDTYTITYTDGTATTYTVTNGRNTDQVTSIPTATAALVGTIYQYIGESTSSYTHGFYYECKNVNGSYQWVNIPVGNDPVEVSNSEPYIYRQGKGYLADMEIEGASVAWNQLVQNGNFASTSGWSTANCTITILNNEGSIKCTTAATAGNMIAYQNHTSTIAGHKYLVLGSVYIPSSNTSLTSLTIGVRGVLKFVNTLDTWVKIDHVTNVTTPNSIIMMANGYYATVNDYYKAKNIQVIDLTALFGSATIADYIYSLEQAQAGSGIAWIKSYGFFNKDYFINDSGSIQSVSVGSRKVVGKNLLDPNNLVNGKTIASNTGALQDDPQRVATNEIINVSFVSSVVVTAKFNIAGKTLNFIYALYNGDVCISRVAGNASGTVINTSNATGLRLCFYEATSSVTVTKTNLYDLQLEIGTTATPYEPYTETAYPFDSTKELRGMFSLVGGELKANGDVWRGDKIQRNWLEPIDLGTLDWIYQSEYTRFRAVFADIKKTSDASTKGKIICSKYIAASMSDSSDTSKDKIIAVSNAANNYIYVRDSAYTDAATFKTAMSGVYFTGEAATPTTEAAQPYQNPQRAYIDGTEEFTDGLTRDVMIPVGNNTTYQQDKVLPSIEDYVDAVTDQKADISAIGTNEDKATASQAYTVGQHFYKDGKFCTAIANIASGGTFTLNTNYVEGTIAEALEASARIDIDPSAATIAAYPVGTMYLVTQ